MFPTEKAQCKGNHIFEYSIIPFQASEKSKAYKLAYNFSNNPTLAVCTGKHEGVLPINQSFINIQGDFINMSSLKKSEDRDSIIIRLHNLSTEDNCITIKCSNLFTNAYIVNLKEVRQEKVEITNNFITLNMRKKQILSLELEYKRVLPANS